LLLWNASLQNLREELREVWKEWIPNTCLNFRLNTYDDDGIEYAQKIFSKVLCLSSSTIQEHSGHSEN